MILVASPVIVHIEGNEPKHGDIEADVPSRIYTLYAVLAEPIELEVFDSHEKRNAFAGHTRTSSEGCTLTNR